MHEIARRYLSLFTDSSDVLKVFSDDDIRFIERCLLHKEERERSVRDHIGNWEYTYTDFPYSRPYLDEYVVEVLRKNQIVRRRLWPDHKQFAICISHDVDAVTKEDKRKLFRQFSKEKVSMRSLVRLSYDVVDRNIDLLRKGTDDYWCFEKWIEEIDKHGFSSTFFYFARPDRENLHAYDCDYLTTDPVLFAGKKMTVAEMMVEMDRAGFEIGLHGSYYACHDYSLLAEQKERIEKIIQKPVTRARQHFLHFDIGETPVTQIKAGIKVDSTLGFNRTVGFRAGTCFPYFLANKNENQIDLLEIPLNIMDTALFNPDALELDEAAAIDKSLELMDRVEAVGGCLTINFHPHHVIRPAWWNTFRTIIREAKSRDAYCIKMNEFEELLNPNKTLAVGDNPKSGTVSL